MKEGKQQRFLTYGTFQTLDRVYIKLHSGQEWIVDTTSLGARYVGSVAINLQTKQRLPLKDLYYEVRNIRTFEQQVIAKRKHPGCCLVFERDFCEYSLKRRG
ncbi:hypothetical protein [Paenilisteria weihenstephanensis]|nr:hypothetical protein [Listeria weihenstephanensis]